MANDSATVFIADDNPILLQGLERALTASNYQVRTATSGHDLLRLLEEAPALPDLLLLDVMMPEISGLDVLRVIQADARWSDLPVVLITAANDEHLPVSALQHGAVDFLTKPFRLGELLARVEAHVTRFRELRRAKAESEIRMQVIDVVRDLNSVVSAAELFGLVTTRVAAIWNVARCSVLTEDQGGEVRIVATSEGESAVGATVPLESYPELQLALSTGEPVLIEDVSTSAHFAELRAGWTRQGTAPPIRSAVAVPFQITEQTRGVFLLRGTVEERPLDAGTLATAQQIVDGMSFALNRTQVFETLVEQRRHLHDLAHTDELTGCASRRAVLQYLADELDLARRRETSLSVVLLDLDGFKAINDSYGHLAGDAVLRTFGEWLQGEGAHRAKDLAGRYGGDEFVIVLPDTGVEGAQRFAERAREYMASVTFVFGDTPARTSLSAGIAARDGSATESVEELIERADAALYEAKEAGRDCIRLARRNGHLSIEAP